MSRTIRAPRGSQLTCKGWLQEAALRMLMNTLDPEVAEAPEALVVYSRRGQAARSWDAFDAIVDTLTTLEHDETLLVQSGKPVAVFTTHPDAPRVLIANANLVPHWATQEHFDALAAQGLIMYGQMTAGSWTYIGTQGILQGTYETLGALARQKRWRSLRGKFVLTAGLGGMGGAQPLAITMNEGVGLIVEVDPARAQRRLETGYIDVVVDALDEALASPRRNAGGAHRIASDPPDDGPQHAPTIHGEARDHVEQRQGDIDIPQPDQHGQQRGGGLGPDRPAHHPRQPEAEPSDQHTHDWTSHPHPKFGAGIGSLALNVRHPPRANRVIERTGRPRARATTAWTSSWATRAAKKSSAVPVARAQPARRGAAGQ